jgi:hypothetical protein
MHVPGITLSAKTPNTCSEAAPHGHHASVSNLNNIALKVSMAQANSRDTPKGVHLAKEWYIIVIYDVAM